MENLTRRECAVGVAGSLLRGPAEGAARMGVCFRNAYCGSPVGVPGRASMRPGRFASDVNAPRSSLLSRDEPLLFNLRKDPGEVQNLARTKKTREIQAELHGILTGLVDPDTVARASAAAGTCSRYAT